MKILVIDIETTGFLNKGGKIVEIGIIELCLETGETKILFDKVINPMQSMETLENSWIVTNKYMTVNDIINGHKFEEIVDELQCIISKYTLGATAFNRSFDFDFLGSYGITFPKMLPCPMILSTNICKLPKTGRAALYFPGGYKWPKVEEAYKYFFPNSNYVEIHRGADDAVHEAAIVYELHKLNKIIV